MSAKLLSKIEQYHRRLVLTGAKKPLDWLVLLFLLPLSLIYGLIGWVRIKAYAVGVLSSYRAPVPVISVGNLAVGGTGKTPVVDWLVKQLIQQGKQPAIVSRGYGGSFVGGVGVVSAGQGVLMSPAEAGDEPCLLARRNPSARVLIAKKRAAGVRAAVEKCGADVVILDDGFQHRAVQRDVDLVLVDGTRPFGNGLPLPAGLLREFTVALNRADLLLMTRVTAQTASFAVGKPVWKSCHQLADFAIDLDGGQIPLSQLQGQRLLAFAGIADPESFFSGLEKSGLVLKKRVRLSDHERYDPSALERINADVDGIDALLTTEKDGVKLTAKKFSVPCYRVPMSISIGNESEFKAEIFRRLWRS